MSGDLEAFRTEVRAWLADNCPATMRMPMPEDEVVWGGARFKFHSNDARLWLERMGEKGWTAPEWPKEYGGGGLSKDEAKILREELNAIKARPALISFGIWMLGPVLLEYASEDQKKRFIPDIVKGKTRWCQGYSEPGSGSDLASLKTRAEDKGDHFVINGQKVWTSYADQCDWIFCLVRTDTSQKHGGISFVLFDMESPGVSTRPIKLISGSSPFCETFFDDVRVPKDQLVGELGGGWEIAKALLQHERVNISSGSFGAGAGEVPIPQLAKDHIGEVDGRIADPIMRDRVAQLIMDGHAFFTTTRKSTEQSKAGMGPGAASSIFKYVGAELNKRRYDLLMDLLGTEGLGWEGKGFSRTGLDTTRRWLRSKANSIEGGTSEINLNVIAKRVLGLMDHQ